MRIDPLEIEYKTLTISRLAYLPIQKVTALGFAGFDMRKGQIGDRNLVDLSNLNQIFCQ